MTEPDGHVQGDPGDDHHEVDREHRPHDRTLAPSPDDRRWGAAPARDRLRPLAALVAVALAGCGGSTLGRAEVTKEADAIASLAAEGALVADGAARGRTTATFTRVHAEELGSAAAAEAGKLDSARPAPGLADPVREVSSLAADVARLLDGLAGAAGDRAESARLRLELERAAEAARRLAERP